MTSEIAKDSVFSALRRGLIAILRGVRPDEVEAIADVLFEAGFEVIEIPLNSPDPLRSIEFISRKYAKQALIGAGTVLKSAEVKDVFNAGGKLILSPNMEKSVIQETISLGLISMPGVFTPTEAHAALQYGATALKFFPASVLGAGGVNAIRAILPGGTILGAVGGITESSFSDYCRVGVRLFGLGSNLYKPGDLPAEVKRKAEIIISCYDEALNS